LNKPLNGVNQYLQPMAGFLVMLPSRKQRLAKQQPFLTLLKASREYPPHGSADC
jgi:hypothetical protein